MQLLAPPDPTRNRDCSELASTGPDQELVKRSQLNMAIPPEVLAQLKERAEQEGVSTSALALRAIKQLLATSPEGLSLEERVTQLEEQVRKLQS